jgi:hypothetical protein
VPIWFERSDLVVSWACAGIANESPPNFFLAQLVEFYLTGMGSEDPAKEGTWPQLNP